MKIYIIIRDGDNVLPIRCDSVIYHKGYMLVYSQGKVIQEIEDLSVVDTVFILR